MPIPSPVFYVIEQDEQALPMKPRQWSYRNYCNNKGYTAQPNKAKFPKGWKSLVAGLH